ncbi:MAG: hypothetical protein WA782_05280 [Sulfitobacter sp.]
MAVSSTSFEERLARINNGKTANNTSIGGHSRSRRTFRARCLTFPFIVGVGILTAGTAYAFAASPAEINWVMALAG